MTPQSSSSLFSSRGNIGNKFSAKYEKQRSITNSPGPAWFGWLARLTEASQQQPPRRPRRSQIAFARQIDCEEVAGGRGAAPPCRAPDIIKPPEFTAVVTGPGAARRREDGNTAHRRRGERGAACRGRVAVRRCGPRHGGAGVAPWPGQAGRRRSQMSAFTRHFAEENKVESPGPVSRVSAPHHAAAAHWHTATGSHYCSTAHNIKVFRFLLPT